jgi:PEP-CTERM motif
MRRAGLGWMAIVAIAGFGASIAQAGVTCKVIPSWCPANADRNGSEKGIGLGAGNGSSGSKQTPVPEPGSLMLLAAGASAVGGAALRRRRKQKKD